MSLHSNALLARDAEGLFWMARYLERVENLARLIDVTQTSKARAGRQSPGRRWWRINADEEGLAGRPIDGPR